MSRLRFSMILFLALASLADLFGAGPVRNHAVTAELVARDASIQPGHPFWVGLKMVHDEHWHSYWINAGTGYPTTLEWTLPPGFKAGEIEWPTPHVVRTTDNQVTGLGYEGENILFVRITPPADLAPGTPVTLKAKAAWLMCKEVCMPGEAALDLTLPVAAGTPAANPTVAPDFDRRLAALPAPDPDWTTKVSRAGKKLTLHLTASGKANGFQPGELHFFDRDGILDYAAPQTLRGGNGSFDLELTLADDAKPEIARLVGVLSSSTGWREGQGYAAIAIDDPIGGAASTSTATPASTAGAGSANQTNFGGQVLLAFFGGLILNLMPCVFPVLGIKILGFVNQSGSDRRKVTLHGLVFTAGVLISFWVLAGLLLALRAGGEQLGWGFQLQSPAFVFSIALFLLIFALNMSGLFEVGLAATGVGGQLQMKDGYAGSFFTGALATLVATPCSAPMLAPALGAALSLDAVHSFALFTVIAIGLSLPYLLLSIFPQAVKLLPRPGAWMETFKQLMAFPLYATVGALLWVLAAQTREDDYALLLIVFGLVLAAMSAWVYGRFAQAYGKPVRQRFGRIAALVLLLAGVAVGWPKKAAPPKPGEAVVTWEKWSPEAIKAAQAGGHFVYVDFTARWCATCQANKAAVFHSSEVLTELKKRNVVLLRGDWTSADPAITAELARWGRSAVPFDLIYAPGKPDPVVLPELLTPGKVMEAFQQAGD
ncbi:MAG TPA: thioredoxin family protein [Candidatus Didemnitutus sp.]|nr:thioredoxin family protein [Candidatus Didemnitutus sp.]